MALTVCLFCDDTYSEKLPSCPECGHHNFACDEEMTAPVVDLICRQMRAEKAARLRAKYRELGELWPKPWWRRWLERTVRLVTY